MTAKLKNGTPISVIGISSQDGGTVIYRVAGSSELFCARAPEVVWPVIQTSLVLKPGYSHLLPSTIDCMKSAISELAAVEAKRHRELNAAEDSEASKASKVKASPETLAAAAKTVAEFRLEEPAPAKKPLVSLGKEYTCGGKPATVLTITSPHERCVVALPELQKLKTNPQLLSFYADGSLHKDGPSKYDLVEVKPIAENPCKDVLFSLLRKPEKPPEGMPTIPLSAEENKAKETIADMREAVNSMTESSGGDSSALEPKEPVEKRPKVDMTKKYTINGVPATVVSISAPGAHPVVAVRPVAFSDYQSSFLFTAEGRQYPGKNSSWDLVEVPATDWSKVPADTKVWCKSKDVDKDWRPRHFAGVVAGKPTAFVDGVTSFTKRSGTVNPAWEYMVLDIDGTPPKD